MSKGLATGKSNAPSVVRISVLCLPDGALIRRRCLALIFFSLFPTCYYMYVFGWNGMDLTREEFPTSAGATNLHGKGTEQFS